MADSISTLGIQPSEFWRMDVQELAFWHDMAMRKIKGIEEAGGEQKAILNRNRF